MMAQQVPGGTILWCPTCGKFASYATAEKNVDGADALGCPQPTCGGILEFARAQRASMDSHRQA